MAPTRTPGEELRRLHAEFKKVSVRRKPHKALLERLNQRPAAIGLRAGKVRTASESHIELSKSLIRLITSYARKHNAITKRMPEHLRHGITFPREMAEVLEEFSRRKSILRRFSDPAVQSAVNRHNLQLQRLFTKVEKLRSKGGTGLLVLERRA